MLTLANTNDEMLSFIAVSGAFAIPLVAIIGAFTKNIRREREREQTRREVAAYVAEGSMSADDAAKILDAGPRHITERLPKR